MSEPFVGEVRMFAGNFAPRGWAFCDGQLLAVSQNDALFSLLGTIYGGDGRTTFGLPDLRGRVPIHPGSAPGLSPYNLGQAGGAETSTTNHTHATAEPFHGHELMGAAGGNEILQTTVSANEGDALASTTHTTIQPYRCVNFIICLYGIYPSRN